MSKKKIKPGMQFRSAYADSNALWEVLQQDGPHTWICEIVNEPIEIDGRTYDGDYTGTQKAFIDNDGDYTGTQKAFIDKEILGAVSMQDFNRSLASEHDKFYQNLPVGAIVHYHNGFGSYVRCERVEGEKRLKPVALVGNWREYDLPHRNVFGEIEYGYHAKVIIQGECFEPNFTNIYEASKANRKDPNPTALAPIDLTLPPMNSEEKEQARLWMLVRRIRNSLDSNVHENATDKLDDMAEILRERNV